MLTRATGRGDARTIIELVAKGADVNAVGKEGLTAIAWAIGQRGEAGVEALLDNGVPFDVYVPELHTVISTAARAQDPWLLRLFLRKGADANTRSRSGEPLIFTAAVFGKQANVDIVLDAGADVDRRDEHGDTAAIGASMVNQFEIVEHLLARGADPRAVGGVKRTIAHFLFKADLNPASKAYEAQQRLQLQFRAQGIEPPQ